MKTIPFHQMKDGTEEDYRYLAGLERQYAMALPIRLEAALLRLGSSLEGYQVSRLEHSLQCASRAERDGADEEMIAAALLHDLGDDLAPHNHAALAAEILRDYVRPEVVWVTAQHGIFQAYYYAHHYGHNRNARDALRDHKWFGTCAAFCENWDQASFDPDYCSFPVAHFRPLLKDIFGRQPRHARAAISPGAE